MNKPAGQTSSLSELWPDKETQQREISQDKRKKINNKTGNIEQEAMYKELYHLDIMNENRNLIVPC